jgi:hypothetical protein
LWRIRRPSAITTENPATEYGDLASAEGRGKGNPWLAGTLGRIAFAHSRADTFLGARYRRLAPGLLT